MKNIETILFDVYGVGLLAAASHTIIWAADRIADVNAAKKELKRANRIREKNGKPLAYVPFGHRLF